MRGFQQACAVAVLLGTGGAAFAETPPCRPALDSVQREVASAGLSAAKTAQVQALLEQAARACKERNGVVAMAGIDQVRDIIRDERKNASGS
ncbi:MAG TPA: hypothetical protein VFA50_08350 [Stellaceae bacterium]|nr:hypothetical protein [Stellaceae bacterium]